MNSNRIIKYLFLLWITCCTECFSQDQIPLVRIICLSGKVTLNGTPVSIDQKIFSSPDSVLEIRTPGLDYAGVLTHDGYADKLIGGKYPVNEIPKTVFNKRYNVQGRHGDTYLGIIRWLGVSSPKYDKTLSNTIHLRWEPEKAPYKLFIKNMFDDLLLDTVSTKNEIDLDLTRFFNRQGEPSVYIEVRSGKIKSELLKVSLIPPDLKLTVESEMAGIPVNHPHRKILSMVILDLNDLYFDLTRELLAITPKDLEGAPEDLRNYVRRIKEKLEIP